MPKRVARAKPTASATLLSTRRYTGGADRLTLDGLVGFLGSARHVDIASAYYSVEFCRQLFKNAGSDGKEVRLLFNGLGGSRLEAQRAELEVLETHLRKRCGKVEIRLGFEPGIFHSKLIVARGSRHTRVLVGSANATMAAMSVNEEILVQLTDGVEPYVDYFERVWKLGTRLDGLSHRLTVHGLIPFFRTGSLYFRPSTGLQTTLNPFSELLNSLSEPDKAKLGAVPLPYAAGQAGIGPFSLARALLPESELDEEDDKPEKERSSVTIKPYAIETCLGHWVPQQQEQAFEQSLASAGSHKRKRWTTLLTAIKEKREGALEDAYDAYVGAMRALLDSTKVDLSRFPWGERRNPYAREIFTKFLKRVVNCLENEEYLNRLCQPFVRGPIPEIWDDPGSYSEFEQSFFDYLEYTDSRDGRRNHVPSRILERCQSPGGASADEIRTALVALLRVEGWGPSDWVKARTRIGQTKKSVR